MPNVTIDLTKIVIALIGLLSTIITYRLIPWIKANTNAKQQQLLRAAVQTAVFAAEQIYGAGEGEKKLDFAIKWLNDHGYDVSREDIEAAVYELINDSGIVIEAPSLTAKVDAVEFDEETLAEQRQM